MDRGEEEELKRSVQAQENQLTTERDGILMFFSLSNDQIKCLCPRCTGKEKMLKPEKQSKQQMQWTTLQ